jgi:hypothetical protein
MRLSAERAEHRVFAIREVAYACRQRMEDWLATTRLRRSFMMRAHDRRWWKLASTWMRLVEEAECAADLEAAQAGSLDHQQDVLEITASCTSSDYEDFKRETEHALGVRPRR